MHCEVEWCGERLLLTGERALVWPAQRTVLVADVHLGKEAVFRRHGLAIPDGPSAGNLARLTALLNQYRCEQVVVLGDFMHAPPRAEDRWPADLSQWLDRHSKLALVVLAGNHDRATGRRRLDPRIRWQAGSLAMGPFRLHHEPPTSGADFGICGHLHPVVRVGLGAERLRAPVYWQSRDFAVLPAFGQFTGGHPVSPAAGDRVWLVDEGAIFELPVAGAGAN